MTVSCFRYKAVSFSQKHQLMRIFVNSLEMLPSQRGWKTPVLSQVSSLYASVSLYLASHSCIGWMSKPMLDRVLESRSVSEALRCLSTDVLEVNLWEVLRLRWGPEWEQGWDQWPDRGDTEASVPSLRRRAQWGGHHPEASGRLSPDWPINTYSVSITYNLREPQESIRPSVRRCWIKQVLGRLWFFDPGCLPPKLWVHTFLFIGHHYRHKTRV